MKFPIAIKPSPYSNLIATLCNLLLVYVVYMVCRIAYVWENWDLFHEGWHALSMSELLRGSLRFDTSAIVYTNAIYILLMLLPLHIKERNWWHSMTKSLFVIVNSIGLTANLIDAVYSRYTGRRTTFSFFSEFSHEDNLGGIVGAELTNHWYLLLLGLLLVAALILCYTKPSGRMSNDRLGLYYAAQSLSLCIAIPLCICGMRGGATKAIRPITLSNANQYVNQPAEAAIVLNTPFSIIRTIGKTSFASPSYFSKGQMNALYTPVHCASSDRPFKHRNVVILIVESFGREYIGAYNHHLENGQYKGYTPFIDSLIAQSLTFTHTFANGRKSIDGMPSILSSIPMFVEPFFLTPYSLNNVGGLAHELSKQGYNSAFFHGAENGSMGFQAFARATGFNAYYGRTEYNADSRFDGDKDFDGTWAIWDEPFLQFYALKMTELQQPFITAVFTASSHHPYVVPQEYQSQFPEEGIAIHKCIRYTDQALRKFFATASQQPWYDSTIFVLTSDHTNLSDHDEFRTSIGVYAAPILFFDPSGQLPRGCYEGVAQQIDIMPTLLNLLGHNYGYIAFGKDLLDSNTSPHWAVNYNNGIYQWVQDSLLIQYDGQTTLSLYNYEADPLLRHNLLHSPAHTTQLHDMEQQLKAVVQSYMERMTSNQLLYDTATDSTACCKTTHKE